MNIETMKFVGLFGAEDAQIINSSDRSGPFTAPVLWGDCQQSKRPVDETEALAAFIQKRPVLVNEAIYASRFAGVDHCIMNAVIYVEDPDAKIEGINTAESQARMVAIGFKTGVRRTGRGAE